MIDDMLSRCDFATVQEGEALPHELQADDVRAVARAITLLESEPERFVGPRTEVFNMAWRAEDQEALGAQLVSAANLQPRTSCSACHR